MTRRVFVANRGEIAVRIIEACDRLGFDTVLGVSSADTGTLAARRAGRTVVLGGPQPRDSYLAVDTVLHAAIATGCTALHPGYGFLSERADLAQACEENGVVFIGPSPAALRALGDKLSARDLATRLGVPVSPGGATRTLAEAERLAAQIGFPVLVKAAFGGGGRGMKLVTDHADLPDAWSVASSEAQSAFGDGTVFLERFVTDAKHVEVQILGDRHQNRVHLGERECSVQYRYQKVVEESPCAAIDQQTRDLLTSSALRIAAELDYVGLGTVEFLYDVQRGDVAFLEVNPRVQVEHPVTEQVTGIDLVREQILAVLGASLPFDQDDVAVTGHAVQCRITAQDPARDLHPTPGPVKAWRPPVAGGVRLDSHIFEGYDFPPYYDALMAKLITWGSDRADAVRRMSTALDAFEIGGITTSRELLRRIVSHPDFTTNTVTTNWLHRSRLATQVTA